VDYSCIWISWKYNKSINQTQGTISLLLGLTVGYEIEPVEAGEGWYLDFLVWDDSFGV